MIIKSQLGDQIKPTLIETFPIPLNVEFNPSILPIPTINQYNHQFLMEHTKYDTLDPGKPIFADFVSQFSDFVTPSLRTLPPKITADGNSTNNTTNNSTHTCLEFFFFSKPAMTQDIIGELPEYTNGPKSGLLGRIPQRKCKLYNGTEVEIPYYVQKDNAVQMQQEVFNILTSYNKVSLDDVRRPPYSYPLPDGTVEFKVNFLYHPIVIYFIVKGASENGTINYVIAVNDNQLVRYHRANNFTRLGISFYFVVHRLIYIGFYNASFSGDNSLIIVPARLALMSMINDAFVQFLTNITYTILNTKFVQVILFVHYLFHFHLNVFF